MISDLKTFAIKGCKIAAAIIVFNDFSLFICSLRLNAFLSPPPEVQSPNYLLIFGILGEKMERSGLRFKKKLLLIKGVKSPS